MKEEDDYIKTLATLRTAIDKRLTDLGFKEGKKTGSCIMPAPKRLRNAMQAGALGVAKPKEFVESIEQASQKIALSEQYEEKQTKKYKTYAKIGSKNLYTIKRFIAARFTELINEFLTDPTSLERRFGPNFPIKDVTSYTREKLLAEPWLGIQTLNKLIRSRFRLSEEERNTTYADFPELIEIYDAIYNNWEDVMQEVIPLLMEREKFNPSINNEIEFSSTLESDLLEAFLDAAENETQVPLAWQLGHRNRSSEMSLSATVRRALSTFPVLDENGNQVYDRELGIPLYEDEKVIYNYLHKWLSRYNTKKEMLDVLRGMRGSSHSWISTLVDKLDSDPAFATLFFHNMRLDATNYSILKTEWDKEKKNYVTTNMIVNQSTPAKMIMDEVQDAFAEAAVSAGDRIDIIDSTLKGTASKYAQTLKDIKDNVLDSILRRSSFTSIDRFKDAIKNKDQNLLKAIEDLSKVMNAFGIMVTPAMLRDTVLLDTEGTKAKDVSLYKIISNLNTIGADIKSRYQKDSKAINIFVDKKNNKSYRAYKRIADIIAPVVKETLESSSYANGKSYYTFVPPSFLGQLMNTLRSESNTTVKELLEQEYNSEWFKLKNSNGEDTYAIAMLRELQNSIEEGSSIDREALFDRKVQLSYNGEDYVKLTPTQYLTSIMKEFFYAPESQYAWYRVPILSNKPSSEFIKFKKYDVRTFSSNGPSVIDQLYDVFAQELKRARVVIDRAKNGLKPEELIKTYDIKSEKYAKEIEAVLKKLKAKEKITVADVVKDGKYIFFENGASFKFLDEFNRIIGENTNPELAQFLVDSIFNRNLNPEQIADKIPAVKKEIENIIASRVKNFNTYIESLGMSKNNITTMLLSQGVKIVDGTVDAMIEQFIANDMLMSINIIQLTTTDLAFYKDSIDFQKRFAQVHSPGLRLDADATFMYNGEETAASDGYLRTIFVKDFKVKSAVIDALSAIFEARAKELEKTSKDAARDFRNMAKLAISQYEKINATDAQSLTCPSAYRKKLVMQGKWGSKEIAAFEAIKKGDLSAANLGVVFQPIKPFVFTKTNVASHSAEMPSGISVPNQQKNSEYLLFVANEIFRGQKNSTTLGKGDDALSLFKALSDYMESTHYKDGKYQKDGIDSIQFNSAVKVGEFGVIDLNKLDPNKPIESLKQIIDTNHNTYIRKFKVGDYAIQQEVPAHMQEHYQPMGSQVRALTLSDLIGNSYSISYYDPAEQTHKSVSYSSSDVANLYQELIAANIQESVDALKKDLNLDVPSGLKDARARERYINLRISELLLKESEKDAKNGLDLKRSLLIDENGDFVIPLSDPIHSVRIQQLLNSILKKRINKQPVKGGPVVQVSSFGLSRDLKIVFKNKKGEEIAATKKEGETDTQFMNRMAEEGLSLSHYEMMITCPSKEYEEIFLNPDGTSKDIEKVLKKYPQMKGVLDALAYRIPTEDAYSVLPARVVGFLPRAAGEAVMLPQEITTITGSGFDANIMYIMFPEVKAEYVNSRECVLYKESYTPITDRSTMIIDIKRMSRAQRNNYIFDLQWATFTNPATTIKMFSPGGFDSFESAARKVKLGEKGITYDQVKGKSLEELDEVLEREGAHNITNIGAQVYFFQQNMTAAKLIGIMANASISHHFSQRVGLTIKPKLEFNDVKYGTDWDSSVNARSTYSPIYSESGRFVSRNLISAFCASVDADKCPLFGVLNINMNTVNEFIVMLRMGIDPENAALLLAQPILKDYNAMLDNAKDEFSEEAPLTKLLNMDKYHNVRDRYMSNIKNYTPTNSLTTENLYKNLNEDNGIDPDIQAQSLMFFLSLRDLTKCDSDLTYLTKFNSLSNAPGPYIVDNIYCKHRVDEILKNADKSAIQGIDTIFSENPILKALYDNTIVYSPFTPVFNMHWAYNSSIFQAIIDLTSSLTPTKNLIKPDVIEDLYNSFILFNLYKNGILHNCNASNQLSMNYFLKIFPKKVFDFIETIKKTNSEYSYLADNILLRSMYKSYKKGLNFPLISIESGGIKGSAQEAMKNAWTELVIDSDSNVREIGIGLFYYNLYRSGYAFNPSTFLHFASVEVKYAINGYIDNLQDITKSVDIELNSNDYDLLNSFMVQYLRNNPKAINTRIPSSILTYINKHLAKGVVPEVFTIKPDLNSREVTRITDYFGCTNNTTRSLRLLVTINGEMYVPVDEGTKTKITRITGADSPIVYKRVKRLGIPNIVVEYGPNPLADSNVYMSY